MSEEKTVKYPRVNTVKNPDVFRRVQDAISTAKTVGTSVDVFGNPQVARPCDNLATWTTCKDCPCPCEEPEVAATKFSERGKNRE